MIELLGIRQTFGSFQLGDLDLTIPPASYAVVVGPSGSGKSLLLKTIAGLCQPEVGRVRINGQDVTSLPPERRRVGLVFQEPSLFPHLGVRDNIAFGLKVSGLDSSVRALRIDELTDMLHIRDLLDRRTTSLSGGEIQKVALARALAVRPEVLLLDEPLSQVDHHARQELQAALKDLQSHLSLCCLHVTHDHQEARALGQRCAVMLGGRIVQVGDTEAVFDNPDNEAIGRFLGVDRG